MVLLLKLVAWILLLSLVLWLIRVTWVLEGLHQRMRRVELTLRGDEAEESVLEKRRRR
jgi:hypothetical protein